jgi:glycosyltransferase involved in cell wall biosynthesis
VLDRRFLHGGAVKLLTLKDAFPCGTERFSILYLVSSALPDAAGQLVSLCRKRGIRLVWNQNGVGYPAWAGPAAERCNRPMRAMRALADHVIYQSEFCADSARRFLGPCERPSATLLNPVDLEIFHPRIEPLPPAPIRLLAMGSQNYPERVGSALEALAKLRAGGIEAVLTVAGPLLWENAEAGVRSKAESLGVSDAFVLRPAFTRTDAPELCRSHHILIHPKYMDPCPTVVAEALACGLPVVGSDSGGLPEMVDRSCSHLLAVPKDWERMHTPSGSALARAVSQVVENLPRMAQAARAVAESRFDARRWVGEHSRIFADLVG